MKIFFRTIHLYLSLAAGLVIMVVCFTGAVLVFEKEMQMTIYPERYYVKATGENATLAQMEQSLKKQVAGVQVTSAKVYADPRRSVEFSYTIKKSGKGEGKGANSQAFMNPYTGELISLYSYRKTFGSVI